MKIAVTTAGGQLGQAIIRNVKKEIGKENVIGIARTPEKALHLDVEIRKGDYNNREELGVALKDVQAVLLVSGLDAPEKRIVQHRNVIEAAKANKVQKIVYTSIIGDPGKTTFAPIIKSNRQTEDDIMTSGLDWVIGRNGLYIEPDLEYVAEYEKAGVISNSAGDGKCGYTSRAELGYAYANMLLNDQHHGHIYNLVGESISQAELAALINQVYGTKLAYQPISVEEFTSDRIAALGDFYGTVIGGIYEGIKNGAFDLPSDFKKATGRAHKSALVMIKEFKKDRQ